MCAEYGPVNLNPYIYMASKGFQNIDLWSNMVLCKRSCQNLGSWATNIDKFVEWTKNKTKLLVYATHLIIKDIYAKPLERIMLKLCQIFRFKLIGLLLKYLYVMWMILSNMKKKNSVQCWLPKLSFYLFKLFICHCQIFKSFLIQCLFISQNINIQDNFIMSHSYTQHVIMELKRRFEHQ